MVNKNRTLLTSHHVNYMIYRYLQETGFTHSAFTFANESRVVTHTPVDPNSVAPGSLIALLQKGLQFLELEANLDGQQDGDVDGDFTMLTPEELITNDIDTLRQLVAERREEAGTRSHADRKREQKVAARDKAQEKERSMAGAAVAAVMPAQAPPIPPVVVHGTTHKTEPQHAEQDTNNGPAPMEEEPSSTQTEIPADAVTTLTGHTAEVYMCSWHPNDPLLLASGAGDETARLWMMPAPHSSSSSSSSSSSVSQTVLKHDLRGDKQQKDVTVLDWQPDGASLATGAMDGIIRLWTKEGKLKQQLDKHTGPVFALRWNKKGDLLLSGSMDQKVIVWDVKNGEAKQTFNFHTAAALDVDWRNNVSFASCSSDRHIYVCRLGDTSPYRTWTGHTDEVNALRWDASGALLASCSDDCTVRVWSSKSDDCLHAFTDHQREVYTVRWSPTGAGSPNPNLPPVLGTASFDHTVRLWDVSSARCSVVLQGHTNMVYSLAFSPNGKYVATGSFDNTILVWNVADGSLVKSFRGDAGIYEVAWNSTGDKLAGCSVNHTVRVLDMRL